MTIFQQQQQQDNEEEENFLRQDLNLISPQNILTGAYLNLQTQNQPQHQKLSPLKNLQVYLKSIKFNII